MNRAVWFIICTLVGIELIAWGLLVPAHIRAVDAQVLELTGTGGVSLAGEGLSLVNLEKIGPARMLLQVANQTKAVGRETLATAVRTFEQSHPKLRPWGGAALYLERVFEKAPPTPNYQNESIVDLLVSDTNRATLMTALKLSRRPGVLEILETRNLTNTVTFPPALSASGQPLDATIVTTALLFQQDHFLSGLRNSLQALVSKANHGGDVRPLEAFYLDVLALGKRLDWAQLVNLMRLMPDTNSLEVAAGLVRDHEGSLPVIYSAIHFADSPKTVAKYLEYFPSTGLADLTYALHCGGASARELVEKQLPIHYPTIRQKLVAFGPVLILYEPLARITTRSPFFGFCIKYGLCLLGALLIARAITYLSPALVDELLYNRPILTGPQVVIGLCLLSVVLFFTESLVTRATPAAPMPLHIKIPMASSVLRATIPHHVRAMIDKFSAISLVTFFIMQATIYVLCRVKLAQVRRETLPSKLKLRLLENEEQLFDAGLYFGFVGTVVSLILVSIGIIKPSLMAAYSSTSFGIVFVSILKIFHVRPYKRQLILDADLAEREVQVA